MNKTKERHLIISIAALVAVTLGFLGYLLYTKTTRANMAPVIMCASDEISISVKATVGDLLTGVTAVDAEDGDITSRIVIESISSIAENGKCTITYAVCDSDNKVSSTSRAAYFTDYHSPKFEFLDDFIYNVGEKVAPLNGVRAYDCFDGDITGRISMAVVNDEDYASSGTKEVEFRVANNYGDTSVIRVAIFTNEAASKETPKIKLSNHIVYIMKDYEMDPISYINSIELGSKKYSPKEYGNEKIYADLSSFDPSAPGNYRIPIYCENGEHVGRTMLYVVVEG